MAQRKFFVDLNLNKNKLLEAVLEVSASDPAGGVAGQIYFNSGTGKVMIHNGSSWSAISSDVEAMRFKGGVDITAASPGGTSGDTYVVTTAGTPGSGWTFDPAGTSVQVGDVVIYNAADSKWVVVQRNIDSASESTSGFIQIATAGEITTGTDNTKAVTPAKLATAQDSFRQSQKLTNSYVTPSTVSILSTGTTVNHQLNTTDVQVSVYDSTNNLIDVQVSVVDANNISLSANATVAANRVVVVGYKKP